MLRDNDDTNALVLLLLHASPIFQHESVKLKIFTNFNTANKNNKVNKVIERERERERESEPYTYTRYVNRKFGSLWLNFSQMKNNVTVG